MLAHLRHAGVAFGVSLVCLTGAGAAAAAPIAVNTTSDAVDATDGLCSLREAVTAANTDTASGAPAGECAAGSGADVISVPAGHYHPSAVLSITTPLTLHGAGSSKTTIDADGKHRVMTLGLLLGSPISVALGGVTITGGHAPNGGAAAAGGGGGAILNFSSNLEITDSILTDNHAGRGGDASTPTGNGGDGGPGGAILSLFPLTLTATTVSGNSAGDAGNGAGGGKGGAGGAIATVETTTISDSVLESNSAGHGGGEANCDQRGTGGSGGAIDASGPTTIADSTLSGNSAGSAGGCPDFGTEATSGSGGAIEASGSLTAVRSTFSSNKAASGNIAGGVPGQGGGIDASSSVTLTGTTLSSNEGGAGNQEGGALAATGSGSVDLTDVTITNTARGAAVFIFGPSATITQSTLAFNGERGVVKPVSGSVRLVNTLVASNGYANCEGTIDDGGHNLSFPAAQTGNCPGIQGDPHLASALHDNGGPTETLAIGPASAARDQVPPDQNCPALDQREVGRPQGAGCDIGAFEFATPSVAISRPADGGHYPQGGTLRASYACSEASRAGLIASCSGPVARGHTIDTSRAGAYSFTVTAIDKAGNKVARTVHYTIDAELLRAPKILKTALTASRQMTVKLPVANPNDLAALADATLTARLRSGGKKKKVKIGHATVAIPAHGTRKLTVHLLKPARSYLKRHKRLHAVATVVLSASGRAKSRVAKLTITAPKKHARH